MHRRHRLNVVLAPLSVLRVVVRRHDVCCPQTLNMCYVAAYHPIYSRKLRLLVDSLIFCLFIV